MCTCIYVYNASMFTCISVVHVFLYRLHQEKLLEGLEEVTTLVEATYPITGSHHLKGITKEEEILKGMAILHRGATFQGEDILPGEGEGVLRGEGFGQEEDFLKGKDQCLKRGHDSRTGQNEGGQIHHSELCIVILNMCMT